MMLAIESNKETPCPHSHGDAWTVDQMTRHLLAMFGRRTYPKPAIALAYGDNFRRVIRAKTVAEAVQKICEVPANKLGDGVCVLTTLSGCRDVNSRGLASQTAGQIGVMADIDIHPSGTKNGKPKEKIVPKSHNEARAILDTLPVQPTLIIASGSGLHPYYIFDTPVFFRGEFAADQRKAAAERQYGWLVVVNEAFENAGYGRVDATHDLARVLRLAGTQNPKYENAWAEVIGGDGPRCTVEQMDQFRRPVESVDVSHIDTIERAELSADVLLALNDESTHLGRLWSGEVLPKDDSMSGRLYAVLAELARGGYRDENVLAAVCREMYAGHQDENKQHRYDDPAKAKKVIAKVLSNTRYNDANTEFEEIESPDAASTDSAPTPKPAKKQPRLWNDPYAIAELITTPIRLYGEQWYVYRGGMWGSVETAEIHRLAMDAIGTAVAAENKRAELLAVAMEKPPKYQRASVGLRRDVMAVLEAAHYLPGSTRAPLWITGGTCDPADVLPVANGLLNLRTRELLPPTPDYFATGYSPVSYDPAAVCPEWLAFLDQTHEGDADSIRAMQEFFGLTLADDTTYQKAALLVGASRGGKGTHVEILQMLQGEGRVATPKIQNFGDRFGLFGATDAYVAAIQDMRLDATKSTAEIVQNLLTWIGEDRISVEGKNINIRHGVKPRARLIITTNAPPNLREESAAFVNRLIAFNFPTSFAGREDTTLRARLAAELPGILNWAVDGLHRLRARGRFIQPARSADLIESIRSTTSAVHDFFADCCTTEPNADGSMAEIGITELYAAYEMWCPPGRVRRHSVPFGRDVMAYFPGVTRRRGKADPSGYRPWVIVGLRLTTAEERENIKGG